MSTKPNRSKSESKKPAPALRPSLVRYYDPSYLHEITIRTNRGVFGFDPNCQELASKIVGMLYLAATIYGIKVLAVHFMSNHYHGLFEIPSSSKFCKFLMYFHGGLARLSHEHLGSSGKFWSENKWVPVAQDEVSVSRRIRYILGQAVKAGLVEHPVQFPGVSSAKAMIDGIPLHGTVVDRTRRYRDSQLKGGAGSEEVYSTGVAVTISPPQCWAALSPGELQGRYRAIADEAAVTPLHVLRKIALLAGPAPFGGPQVPEANRARAEGPVGVAPEAAEEAGEGEVPLTQCYASKTESGSGNSVETNWIPPRRSESGEPFEQGPPKAKKAGNRKNRLPYLLSANLMEVLEYEARYLAICQAYAEAKQRWHKGAKSGQRGLAGPKFCLPLHTLVGSMPLVD